MCVSLHPFCFSEEISEHTKMTGFYKFSHLTMRSAICMLHAKCEDWKFCLMSVLHIPISPSEGEFAKADAVICGLYAEKAACKTCCLLLTCWAESVHPQSRKAWGSRLSGSIRLPGAPCVLMSLPKALQRLMSPLLAEIRESISRKGLVLCWNETATHAQVPPWAKIYMHMVRRWHSSPGKE